jgi:hypothetical protein
VPRCDWSGAGGSHSQPSAVIEAGHGLIDAGQGWKLHGGDYEGARRHTLCLSQLSAVINAGQGFIDAGQGWMLYGVEY